MEEIRIQVKFTETDPKTGLEYTDALYFTEDEYATISRKEIDTLKKERFDKWTDAVAKASTVETKEEQPKGVK
jgi:hypothetical protein